MPEIQDQKLLYHLTSIKNLEGILKEGIKPRSQLDGFEDIADSEILQKRFTLGLESFVPFHWFARNPFDGGVQKARPNEDFVIITVRRSLASNQNWKVIPRHPLANDNIEVLDYVEGFQSIDWQAMNQRAYNEAYSKSVCMAECLSPITVPVSSFFKIYVPDTTAQEYVLEKSDRLTIAVSVEINEHMFLK